MFYAYGVTQQGTYHVKNGIVCQDAHNIIKVNDETIIAAVADGLGSEEYSDIASKIAAQVSTTYCSERITADLAVDEILALIKQAFHIAYDSIENEAKAANRELDQYDTTLSLAILCRDRLYYGHSGDSGIIALTTDGLYEKVTEQQRDSEGRVFPLYFGEEKWVFGEYPESVASVFLATDGIFEILFPVYIRNQPVSIYVALAQYFMDPHTLNFKENGEEAVEKHIASFLASIADEQVNDDKTAVVILNDELEIKKQPDEYYEEPDWKALKQAYDDAWRREAYPHLYESQK